MDDYQGARNAVEAAMEVSALRDKDSGQARIGGSAGVPLTPREITRIRDGYLVSAIAKGMSATEVSQLTLVDSGNLSRMFGVVRSDPSLLAAAQELRTGRADSAELAMNLGLSVAGELAARRARDAQPFNARDLAAELDRIRVVVAAIELSPTEVEILSVLVDGLADDLSRK